MTSSTEAELLFLPESEELRFLPEGPTSLGPGRFSWVAIQHGADSKVGSLNIFDIGKRENSNFALPGRPGFAKPTTREGIFLVGADHSLALFDIGDSSWQVLTDEVDNGVEGTIVNDGTVYADSAVFGTKDLEFATPKASLYLYRGSDSKLISLRDGQVCSNGKDVIDAGQGKLSLIDIDSPTRKIVRYAIDIDNGSLSDEETIVDLSDLPGVPDGMVMSPDEQSLIVSLYNPNPAEYGETHQYSLYNGALEHVWRTPGSPQATCPLLLELPDGSIKLIITTAVEHMPAERRSHSPNAGGLFIADTTFKSPPVNPIFQLAGASAN